MVSKDENDSLKVASAGLKVFEKNDKKVTPPPASFCYHLLSALPRSCVRA